MKDGSRPAKGALEAGQARQIFEGSEIAMVLTNPRAEDNPIIFVNRAFERLTGYPADLAVGRNCRFLQSSATSPKRLSDLRDAIEARKSVSVVLENARANGEPFLNALTISPIFESPTDAEPVLFLGLQQEVERSSEKEQAEEFEGLINEIQHRVKNHLSMVLGLIRIKSRDLGDPHILVDLSRRVESLQLLYEELSAARRETNEDRIQLGAYLGRVANAIAYLDGRPGVRMNVHVEPLVMETETAVRIGLIVSEILTNAMQHAFDGQASGLVELRVMRTHNGGMRAIISDDGVGLPDGLVWPNQQSLGGSIVEGLCEGLGASLNVSGGAVGTTVTLDVPMAD